MGQSQCDSHPNSHGGFKLCSSFSLETSEPSASLLGLLGHGFYRSWNPWNPGIAPRLTLWGALPAKGGMPLARSWGFIREELVVSLNKEVCLGPIYLWKQGVRVLREWVPCRVQQSSRWESKCCLLSVADGGTHACVGGSVLVPVAPRAMKGVISLLKALFTGFSPPSPERRRWWRSTSYVSTRSCAPRGWLRS